MKRINLERKSEDNLNILDEVSDKNELSLSAIRDIPFKGRTLIDLMSQPDDSDDLWKVSKILVKKKFHRDRFIRQQISIGGKH